jgi:hypothetical protein
LITDRFTDKSVAFGKVLPEDFCDLLDELNGLAVLLPGDVCGVIDADGQILGHEAVLYGLDDGGLQSVAEVRQLIVAVQLGTVQQSSRPGVDAGN